MAQDIKTVTLHRGTNGLGFNIRGGKDQPHVPDDSGIFVTKIRATGAAAQDGSLQEGDKILEINGQSMEDIKHNEAVNLFLSAGDEVTLKFWSGAEEILMKEFAEKNNRKSIVKLDRKVAIGVGGVLLATVVVLYFRKNITDGISTVASKIGLK